MTLREDQIQRYSRQILLKEVGGRGQLRLLANRVVVQGEGMPFDVAVAYLAASGTPVQVERTIGGFVGGGVGAFSPDALTASPITGWLGPLEALAHVDPSLIRVAVGRATVVALPVGQVATAHQEPAGPAAEPVTLGAWAALTMQRLVLGLETGSTAAAWDAERGRWRTP